MKMQFSSRIRRVALTGLLFCAAESVCAQSSETEEGFYTGVSAGVTSFPARPEMVLGGTTLNSTDASESDLSWSVTGGYRFSRNFALEVGYTDLGEGRAHLIDFAGSPLQTDLRFSARGVKAAAVLLFPMRKWEPFIKVGVLYQDVDLNLNGIQSGTPFTFSSSSDGMKIFWEGGVSYRFDARWKATFGLTLYPEIGNQDETGETDLFVAWLGVTYRF
jgi:OmpA-OmpF porin, OOP family